MCVCKHMYTTYHTPHTYAHTCTRMHMPHSEAIPFHEKKLPLSHCLFLRLLLYLTCFAFTPESFFRSIRAQRLKNTNSLHSNTINPLNDFFKRKRRGKSQGGKCISKSIAGSHQAYHSEYPSKLLL